MQLVLATVLASLWLAAGAPAQAIIAQSSGLANPTDVIDFGVNLYPNNTPITSQFVGVTVTHSRYFTVASANNIVGGFLTNDFSASPNTVSLKFAQPISDVSFVYHQISTNAPSTIRALLEGATVSSFSGTWNQLQPNNWFGFRGIRLDEVQIDFVVDFNLDTIEYRADIAQCLFDNGNDINPPGLQCANLPVLGTTWHATIAPVSGTLMTLLAYAPTGLQSPQSFPGGELLIPLSPPPVTITGFGSYSLAIPSSPSWLGTSLAFQGFRVDDLIGGPQLVALNAQTLVLGF